MSAAPRAYLALLLTLFLTLAAVVPAAPVLAAPQAAIAATGPADAPPEVVAPADAWWPEWLGAFDRNDNLVDDRAERVANGHIAAGNDDEPVSVLLTYLSQPSSVDVLVLVDQYDADPSSVYVFSSTPTINAAFPAARVAGLGSVPGVVAVEWDYPVYPMMEFAAPAVQAHDYEGTGANTIYNGQTAETLGYTGAGMVVAVIDTGVQDNHPALVGKLVASADSSSATTVECVNPDDVDGHGTHVAGIALGNQASSPHKGTAMDADVVEIQITKQLITFGGVNRGLDWVHQYNQAIAAGSPKCGVSADDRVDVATVSFGSADRGGPNAGSTETIVNTLVSSGTVVTISVGNCGPSPSATCVHTDSNGNTEIWGDDQNGIGSPGNAANAIGVANFNDGNSVDRTFDSIAPSSSRGPNGAQCCTGNTDPGAAGGATSAADLADRYRKPDIAGPGTGIFAANAFHTTGADYVSKSGTSMSAPAVAGIAALLLQAGEDAKADTGGVNRMAPTGSSFVSNNYVVGANPVRDALIFGADYKSTGAVSTWSGPSSVGAEWNNAWGYGQANAFDALCWAWENVLVPAGASPPPAVNTGCGIGPVPVTAEAGGPYSGTVGSPVQLSGSAIGGTGGPYTFSWAVTSKPLGSTAAVTPPSAQSPGITPDIAGVYQITLTVDDGVDSDSDVATLIANNDEPEGCGGIGVTLALETEPDSITPGGVREATCLGAYENDGTFSFRLEVVDNLDFGSIGHQYYDIFFTPSWGLEGGEQQLVSAFWDGETLDPFWSLPPPALYSPDPSKTVTAAWEGNILVMSFDIASNLGEPADQDTFTSVFGDLNQCGTGATCSLTHDDFIPDDQNGEYTFRRLAGGDGREVPLGTDPTGDGQQGQVCGGPDAAPSCATGNAANDLVGVGAGDDPNRFYLFAEVDDMSAWADAFHVHHDFDAEWANNQHYSTIASIDGPGAGSGIGLYTGVPGAGARISQDVTVDIVGDTIRVGVLRSEIGLPQDGSRALNIVAATTVPTTNQYATIDQAGPFGPFVFGTPAPDDEPPTAPSNLVALDAGTGDQIDLGWDASTDNVGVDHYRIYRDTAPGVPTDVGHLVGTSFVTAFSDAGLANGQTYFYKVTAVDEADNESPPSSEDSATVTGGDDTTPPTPFTLAGTDPNTDGEVQLDWTASSDPESGIQSYSVVRGGFTIDVVGPGTLTYTDSGLTNGQAYTYEVVATNGQSLTTASNQVSVTPTLDVTPPAKVTGLTASPSPFQVSLAWDDNVEDDLASYNVYRDGALLLSGVTTTDLTDTGLTNGVEYCYTVSAVDERDNEGPESDPACATPDIPPPPPVVGWPQFHRDAAKTAATPETASFGGDIEQMASTSLGRGTTSGAVFGDIDGDGEMEIVIGLDTATANQLLSVAAYEFDGAAFTLKWTTDLPAETGDFTEGFVTTPALVEVGDGDDGLEVVVTYNYVTDGVAVSGNRAFVALLDGDDGSIDFSESIGIISPRNAPTVADIDADGVQEVLVSSAPGISAGGILAAFEPTGASLARTWTHTFPVEWGMDGSPVVADLDADGTMEIVATAWFDNSNGRVTILDGTGAVLRDLTAPAGLTGVAAGDLDGDGVLEIVTTARTSSTTLRIYDTAGGPGGYVEQSGINVGRVWTAPAIGDVDGDGRLEVVTVNHDEFINGDQSGGIVVSAYNGNQAIILGALGRGGIDDPIDRRSPGGPALVNTDLDPELEIVFGSKDGFVYGYSFDGFDLIEDWTFQMDGGISAPPMVTDVTGDGKADIVLADESANSLSILGAPNRAPILDTIADVSVDEGQSLSVPLSASDPDGDALTLSATGLPTDASLTDNGDGTGTIDWTPTFDDAGTYTITVDASDGMLTDSHTFDVTVVNVNRAPVLDALIDRTVDEDALLSFAVSASDPDGDQVTLSVSNAPAGSSFTDHLDGTGSFSWTPDFDQAGVYTVTFAADDDALSDTASIEITVVNVDRAPVLDPVGNQAGRENVALSFGVTAGDPDGESVALSATGLPSGASFVDNGDGTGDFAWTPSAGQTGSYQVTFTASNALSDSETITIDVGVGNVPPVVSVIGSVLAEPGTTVSVTATATDSDGPGPIDWTVTWSPNVWLPTVTENPDGTVTWKWNIPSSERRSTTVTFRASDGQDTGTGTTDVTLIVAPSILTLAPKEVSTGALSNTVLVNEPTRLRGMGSDDGTIVRAEYFPEGLGGPALPTTLKGAVWETDPYTYTTTGTREIAFQLEDDHGLVSTATRLITVRTNRAPNVNAGADVTDDAAGPAGLEVTLTGTANDPDQRPLSAGSFLWVLPASAGGGTAVGTSLTHTFPYGSHLVELQVTDANGATGTDTVVVNVDDTLTASATLDGAEGDPEEVMVVSDPDTFLLGTMSGEVLAIDNLGRGIEGAQVLGVVTYFGTSGNPIGVTVAEFGGTTDENGVFSYDYLHEVGGAAGYAGVASLPGYHELHITVASSSLDDAPVQDLEEDGVVLRYNVRPATPSL